MKPTQTRSPVLSKRVLSGLLALQVLAIAWLVLNPSDAVPSGAILWISAHLAALGLPTWLTRASLWDYLLNVALFVPLGFVSALLWQRVPLWGWAIFAFTISSVLEAMQFLFLDARSPSLSDVSSNTIGAFLGALLAVMVTERTRCRATIVS